METFRKQKPFDSFCRRSEKEKHCDWPLVKFSQKNKNSYWLYSRFGKTDKFSTESLNIHFVKSEKEANFLSLDGFLCFEKRLPARYAIRNRWIILEKIRKDFGNFGEYWKETFKNPWREMSMVKMWNVSIVGSLILGMFVMTFIYRYLGQNAAAVSNVAINEEIAIENAGGQVLGENAELKNEKGRNGQDYVSEMGKEYENKKESSQEMEEKIREMVDGYPIEIMASLIAEQDKIVAAFMISIAKKESDWGKHVPVLDGEDCYNYWGYRGIRDRMGTGGHTCFDSPRDAVNTVAKRIRTLVNKEGITTPKEMVVVWKCGYDCSWDDPAAVRKWVSDVEQYFDELMGD